MSRKTMRTIAPLVALQLVLALAGCGETPTTAARLGTGPAAATAVAPTVTTTQTLAPAASVTLAPTVTTQKAAAPTKAGTGLFDHDYDPSAVSKFDATSVDPTTATAIQKDMKTQDVSFVGSSLGTWGMIGAAALAALGIPAIGYAMYTGIVGSTDLMYPTDMETLRKDPHQYGWTYEPDYFLTADNLKLVAWYMPAEVPTRKGILVLHGHTSDMDMALKKYGPMLHHDYNLYFYDSRFHGDSEGKFTTLGYFERNDALIALQRLRDRGNDSIGVMGESMGAAVGIEATAMDPTVKACWADCAFDSLFDAVEPRALKRGYPFPNYVGFCVVETASLRAHANLASADPINWVDKISPRPLQLIHGLADDDTTPINSQKLYDKAGLPKDIWWTPNTTHADSWETYPDEYKSRIQTFFHNSL